LLRVKTARTFRTHQKWQGIEGQALGPTQPAGGHCEQRFESWTRSSTLYRRRVCRPSGFFPSCVIRLPRVWSRTVRLIKGLNHVAVCRYPASPLSQVCESVTSTEDVFGTPPHLAGWPAAQAEAPGDAVAVVVCVRAGRGHARRIGVSAPGSQASPMVSPTCWALAVARR
jgi:hypothetical protein